MIDQEKPSTFSWQLSHYSVTLAMREKRLASRDKLQQYNQIAGKLQIAVEIYVLDYQTLCLFHATVDQQFIGKQDIFFIAYFEIPEYIFTHLAFYFSDIIFEKRVLRFNYTSGTMITRQASIQLEEEIDPSSFTHWNIVKLKEHIKIQKNKKDSHITAFQNRLRELADQFRQFKKENEHRKKYDHYKNELTEEQLQKKENNNKALEKRVQIFKERLQNGKSQYKETEESQLKNESNIKEIKQMMKNYEKVLICLQQRLLKEQIYSKGLEDRLQRLQEKQTIA